MNCFSSVSNNELMKHSKAFPLSQLALGGHILMTNTSFASETHPPDLASILITAASLVVKAFYLFTHSSLLTVYFNQAKDRICKLVQNGVDSGARLLLDGRDIVVIPIFQLFIHLPAVLLYIVDAVPEVSVMCRFLSSKMAILSVQPFWLMLEVTWSVTR